MGKFVLSALVIGMIWIAPVQSAPILLQGNSSGCLGRDIQSCLDYLKSTLTIRDWDEVETQLNAMNKIDVNGKRVGGSMLFLSGKPPNLDKETFITIDISKNEAVHTISGSLFADPFMAASEDEYDSTGLFEIASVLLGSDCPSLEKLAFYKFFENVVKPRLKIKKDSTNFSDTSVTTSHGSYASDIPYCGKRFSFSQSFGVDTNLVDENNSSGTYYNTSISFK